MIGKQQIKDKVRECILEWKNLSQNDIVIERMTGITNVIYKISAPHKQLDPIIYRQFGKSQDNIFLERQSELYVYQHIAEIGVGPKIFYNDDDIRIEEFIESTVLPAKCMLKSGYLEQVAFTLSKFHLMKPDNQAIKCQSLFKRVFLNMRDNLVGICQNKLSQDIYTEQQKELVQLLKTWVTQDQVKYLQNVTTAHENQPLAFSHNDLLANNILISKKTNNIVFIDYEYASYNYPIFDIANYINEAQFNYEFDSPPYFQVTSFTPEDEDSKLRFIQAYVVAKDMTHQQFRQKFEGVRKDQKYQKQVKDLLKLLPLGLMLSNLMWGWWGIIVCKNDKIKFDYLAYVDHRYRWYQKIKAQLNI